MDRQEFGTLKDGRNASTYTISNGSGLSAVLCDYGAAIVNLYVKGRNGSTYDVALGYDNVTGYEEGTSYFGASIGRNANRVSDARIEIDGETYDLDANDNENNLHSGDHGTSTIIWDVKDQKKNSITFSCVSGDLEQGFPGRAVMEVTYTVTGDNALEISYHCTSDKTTVMNMTNHCYFNLSGQGKGNVRDHILQIHASAYTPVRDAKAIPTGEIVDVTGTVFDFRTAKPIGQDIGEEDTQLIYGNGYDHNYVLDRQGNGMETAAAVESPESGIRMEVITDLPGIQLYTGNFIGGVKGKGGVEYEKNGGFCLETQYFPNAVNEPNFELPLLHPGEVYETKTVYRFS